MKVNLQNFLLLSTLIHCNLAKNSPWMWRCSNKGLCIREVSQENSTQISLERCKLTCGKFGSIWPKPKMAIIGSSVSHFLPQNVSYVLSSPTSASKLVDKAFKLMMKTLDMYHPNYNRGKTFWKGPWQPQIIQHKISLQIDINADEKLLTLNTNESYTLSIKQDVSNVTKVTIKAPTFFGARHALETFSQLVNYEESANSLQIVNSANISDDPSYKYRGLLLDTSRNFYPIADLKRTLDAMSYNKLNTFHWHMTDSNSVPVEFSSVPKMTYYGAYSQSQIYTASDIRNIVKYALVRGIRVVPELDAPAHVGHGWEFGPEEGLGDLLACFKKEPYWKYCHQPPCGHLNIANENIYVVLKKLYEEILNIFGPVELFHFGGDEIFNSCWNSTDEIVDWMLSKNKTLEAKDYLEVWSEFQEKARQLLQEANKGVPLPGILWTSALNMNEGVEKYLSNESYIIQIWTDGKHKSIGNLLNLGFKLIFSNYDHWYLDCGFSEWRGDGEYWCPPYKGWQTVYDNSPKMIAINQTGKAFGHLILGGEAAVWSEMVDENNLDTMFWPRGSALAERLWSDPDHGFQPAEIRMIHHRQRLDKRGIKARRLQPEWCHQNEGECYAYQTLGDIQYE